MTDSKRPAPEVGAIEQMLRPMPFHDDHNRCCRVCGQVWATDLQEGHTAACTVPEMRAELAALLAENATLRQRAEAAEADTKRLDWLAENARELVDLGGCCRGIGWVNSEDTRNIREAIDAARADAPTPEAP